MNPSVKTEGKCNESINNEFKFIGKRSKLPPPPCLKLVRIMLETCNLPRKYTNMLFSTKALLILLMSAFLAKN